jgi:peptide/nickel transport system substrate-binding protein/2-iminobutanoate/2-iminopropanoate deaminase
MSRTAVTPSGSAPSRLALSPGIVVGRLLFTSGMVAYHPRSGEIVGSTVGEQTRQTLQNLGAVLAAAGATAADVVRCRVHLADVRRDFADFDAAYREFFPPPYPARTTVGSTLAAEGLLVEIDMVAELPERAGSVGIPGIPD